VIYILKYLKGIPGQGFIYQKYHYISADKAGSPDDRRSISGYLLLGGNLVSWKNKK